MTRKHFIAIAAMLKTERAKAGQRDRTTFSQPASPCLNTIDSTIRSLADYLAGQNARFDRDRFIAACGIVDSQCNSHPLISKSA